MEFVTVEELAKVLEGGANVDLKATFYGYTALIYASSNGQTALAQQLIQARADVNAKNRNGATALMHAIDNSSRNGHQRWLSS